MLHKPFLISYERFKKYGRIYASYHWNPFAIKAYVTPLHLTSHVSFEQTLLVNPSASVYLIQRLFVRCYRVNMWFMTTELQGWRFGKILFVPQVKYELTEGHL